MAEISSQSKSREVYAEILCGQIAAPQLWVLQRLSDILPQAMGLLDHGKDAANSRTALRHEADKGRNRTARENQKEETLEQDRLLAPRSENTSLLFFSFVCLSGILCHAS